MKAMIPIVIRDDHDHVRDSIAMVDLLHGAPDPWIMIQAMYGYGTLYAQQMAAITGIGGYDMGVSATGRSRSIKMPIFSTPRQQGKSDLIARLYGKVADLVILDDISAMTAKVTKEIMERFPPKVVTTEEMYKRTSKGERKNKKRNPYGNRWG